MIERMFKYLLLFGLFLSWVSIGVSCKTQEIIAEGLADKNISGGGSFIRNKVGIDSTTKTPTIDSLMVFGDYSSNTGGESQLRITKSEDASVFNSEAKSKTITITYFGITPEEANTLFDKLIE